jgi:DNA-binding CsgD family transcriptional regulator
LRHLTETTRERNEELMAEVLIGRDPELKLLERLLGGARAGGACLLVRGAPGAGKSALIDAARRIAEDRRFTVLSCTGVSSEARLPFAGLHELIRPILTQSRELPAAEREAVQVALGVAAGPVPEVALLGMAVLSLAGSVAERSPVLLIADDVQWLDVRTCEVLAFVGRRLAEDDVIFLAACREDEAGGNPLGTAGLPQLELGPLRPDAAQALLARHAADLDPTVRARILAEAEGNPLALVELPAAARDFGMAAVTQDSMPITSRLKQAFAARLPQLPRQTRTLLLVAALADQRDASEILTAGSLAGESELGPPDLQPAIAAGLVRLAAGDVMFRHPLTRSAVRQAASVAERLAAHAALACALRNEPARRAWHRAASTTGPDENVALDLEGLAERAEDAGATDVRAAALRRAAELGQNSARRAERWLRAAEVSWEAGQGEWLARLLREAESAGLDVRQQARAAYLRETTQGVDRLSGTNPIAAFAAIADDMRQAGDYGRATEALHMIALRCYFSNPDASTRMLVVRAAEAIGSLGPMLIDVLALAAPVERGVAVIERLSALRPGELRAADDHYLGTAATAVGAYDICGGFLRSAINRLRAEGRINHLAQALHTWAWAGVHVGDPAISLPAAEEARELFSETGQPLWAACAQLVTASVTGRRGDAGRAETLTADSERTLLFAGLGPLLAMVCLARGIAALGVGRHTEAYEILARIFDTGDHAHHPHLQAWALTDMIEAALQSGHRDDASELWGKLSAEAAVSGSPLMKIGLLITAPQLADDDSAEPLFKTAVQANLTPWPLHRARLMLAYGTWLRRRHRVAESRVPLRAARDSLDALGALPWAERARQELTAAGERSLPRAIGALDVLSPQELLIAQLAADGLSNREIGQKLYLSHRTVGSHLYRIFPKLGVASRAELAAVVAPSRGPAPPLEPDTVMAREPAPASGD